MGWGRGNPEPKHQQQANQPPHLPQLHQKLASVCSCDDTEDARRLADVPLPLVLVHVLWDTPNVFRRYAST